MTETICPEEQIIKTDDFIKIFDGVYDLIKNYKSTDPIFYIHLRDYSSNFRYYIIKKCLEQDYKINILRDSVYDRDMHIELRKGMTDELLFKYTSRYLIFYPIID